MLLGVKAVIAQSYERIHRNNLIGMGILPLQFKAAETPDEVAYYRHGSILPYVLRQLLKDWRRSPRA
jgi:aconitase A